MNKKKIDVGFNSIEWISHIADIHIRNLKRHREYEHVFETLYSKLREFTGNGIIYIGGDIVHAKTQMSPELIHQTSKFLSTCASIAPTIVITGNHDANLNNPHRLDALSPIINNLNNPNLFYLRDSGIYTIADIDFVVMSIFDDPKKYIKAKDFESTRTKIALFHGTVARSKTDFGFELQSKIKINKFIGYDMVLLGDIHRMQSLQEYSIETKTVDENVLQYYLDRGWKLDDIG